IPDAHFYLTSQSPRELEALVEPDCDRQERIEKLDPIQGLAWHGEFVVPYRLPIREGRHREWLTPELENHEPNRLTSEPPVSEVAPPVSASIASGVRRQGSFDCAHADLRLAARTTGDGTGPVAFCL